MNFGEVARALGAGLTAGGDMMEQRRKEALADKLEKEKEQRAYDNEVNLTKLRDTLETQQKDAIPVRPEIVTDATTGVSTFNQYNRDNKLINSTPATAQQIADKDTEDQQKQQTSTRQSLQDKLLEAQTKKTTAEANAYPEDHALENQVRQAQINNLNSEASNRGMNPRGKAPLTPSEWGDRMLKDKMTQQIINDPDYAGTTLPSGDLAQITSGALENAKRQAAASGNAVDPVPIFQNLLRQWYETNKDKTKPTTQPTTPWYKPLSDFFTN